MSMQPSNPREIPSQSSQLSLKDKMQIEQLVDGELNEQERLQLLMKLETIHNGWRSCALAFLEAQTLKDAFKDITRPSNTLTDSSNDRTVPQSRNFVHFLSHTKRRANLFSSFVSVSVAFILCTLGIYQLFPFTSENNKLASNNSANITAQSVPTSPLVSNKLVTVPEFTEKLAADADKQDFRHLQSGSTPIRTVTFNCPKYGLTDVSASCIERDTFDPADLNASNIELPTELIERLTQDGAYVNARREAYRFSLGDGRVLIIPVDSYNVRYEHIPVR